MDDLTSDPNATAATPINQMERFQAMAQPMSQPTQQTAIPNQQEQQAPPQAMAPQQEEPQMPEDQNQQLKDNIVNTYHPALKMLAHQYDKLKGKGKSTPNDQVKDHVGMLKSLPSTTPAKHLEKVMKALHGHLYDVVHSMRGH